MLKSFIKLFSLAVCIFSVSCFASDVLAADTKRDFDVKKSELNGQLENLVSLASEATTEFDQSIFPLVNELKVLGFSSASTYSLKLIGKVNSGQIIDANRLAVLTAAKTISPKHPEVLLSLSMFVTDFGVFQSLSHFYSGLLELPKHPIFFSETNSRVILLLIFTLCLSLLVAVFGNLVFSSSEVISFLASNFKKSNRIIISSLAMILIYLLPVFVPLFFLLIVWSLIVAFGSSRMRFAPLLSSILVLTFVSFLPYGLKTINFAESEIGKAVDAIQTHDFNLESETILSKNETLFGNSQVVPILTSQNQQRNGEIERAFLSYKNLLFKGISDKGLLYSVQSNVAQIEFNRGHPELAFESWKKLYEDGWREYELLFNLSVSSVATYKKQEYEKYFTEFRNSFRTGEANISSDIKPITAGIPVSSVYSFVVSTIKSDSSQANLKTDKLELILLGSDPQIIKYFSILTMCWGFFLAAKNHSRYRYRVSIVADRSQLKLDQFYYLRNFPILNLFLEKKEWIFFFVCSLILFVLLMLFNISNLLNAVDESLGYISLGAISMIYFIMMGLKIQNSKGAKC